MTCREKLAIEHPELVTDNGCCHGCPHSYNYLPRPSNCHYISCNQCWSREIPGTEKVIEKEKKEMSNTRKTKDQLLEEIKELKREVEKLEHYKNYDDAAGEMKALMDSYVNAGFTEEQAFELVKITVEGTIAARR